MSFMDDHGMLYSTILMEEMQKLLDKYPRKRSDELLTLQTHEKEVAAQDNHDSFLRGQVAQVKAQGSSKDD